MARLYADEDFSYPVIQRLRQLGHDILTAYEAGQASQGIEDAWANVAEFFPKLVAFLLILLCDLPFVAGALLSGEPWLAVLIPITPPFLLGAMQIIDVLTGQFLDDVGATDAVPATSLCPASRKAQWLTVVEDFTPASQCSPSFLAAMITGFHRR